MAIEPKTAPDPKTTQSVFLDRVFKFLCWIVGLIAVLCVLWGIGDYIGYDDAWQAFKSINPANAEAAEAEKLKALKIEAFRNFLLSIGALGAVVIGLVGLYLAIVRTHTLDSQAKTAVKDSKLSEQKHQSEAFAKAIELLGNKDSFAIQLGAVYALEALAKSSRDLHGPIFETLCAYVREKAPAKDVPDLKPADNIETPDAVVVQAILTVAGRRDPKRDPEGFQLDLRNTNLRKADLQDGHFENALFNDARLEGAFLINAHLKDAFLYKAHLEGAILINAHLEGAHLMDAHLEGAHLNEAHLEGAHLYNAHLNDAALMDAHLEGTNLSRVHLDSASLWGVFFDAKTKVHSVNFQRALGIPARPGRDFRTTVLSNDNTIWPDNKDPFAWDRGDDVTMTKAIEPQRSQRTPS